MREILFKAKRTDNGEWVAGFLFYQIWDGVKIYCIGCEPIHGSYYGDIVGCWFEVDEETVCQYTGLTDKNGKKIFENDVVRDSAGFESVVKYSYFNCGCCDDVFGYALEGQNVRFYYGIDGDEYKCDIEVVGNIHDRP